MKWTAITRKSGFELVRDKGSLFFALLFPAIFMLIFGFAFGTFTGGNTTYNIAVINEDAGISMNGSAVNHGENLISVLKDMRYIDGDGKNTSDRVFDVRKDLSISEARELVEDGDLTAYVIIPANFSAAVNAESWRYVRHVVGDSIQAAMTGNDNNASGEDVIRQLMEQMTSSGSSGSGGGGMDTMDDNVTADIVLKGDPGDSSYYSTSGIIQGVLRGYVEGAGKKTLEMSRPYLPMEVDPSSQDPYILFRDEALEASDLTVFDYQVPGIIVFGLLMSSTSVCIILAREESKGTLTRLKLTKMSSFDMLFGTTIPYTVLAVLQVFVLLGVALMMGYQFDPEANLALVVFIALWGCLATVALGLILASIAKNENQGGYLGPMVSVPLSFLSGAFFSLPTITFTGNFLGTGKPFELFDWLPWTQCAKALGKCLTHGAEFGDVTMELYIMMVMTAILFTVGVVLYHRKKLRKI